MKVNVINVGDPWTPPGGSTLYTIHVEGMGEPQRTFDASLAVLGEHEAEEYTSKKGKTYLRVPKAPGSFTPKLKHFAADPKKMQQDLNLEIKRNQSIQRQVAVKGAVELISVGVRKYSDLTAVYNDLMRLLNPEQVLEETYEVEDQGDFAKFLADDQPPVQNYDE